MRRAQNEFGLRIKKIRSDNGTEFKNLHLVILFIGKISNPRDLKGILETGSK